MWELLCSQFCVRSCRDPLVQTLVNPLPAFLPSALYAQLIAKASNWRYNGLLVSIWNLIGLFLVIFVSCHHAYPGLSVASRLARLTYGKCYKDSPRLTANYTARHVLREIDYVGGLLSTFGVLLFMMGMQWGVDQGSSP